MTSSLAKVDGGGGAAAMSDEARRIAGKMSGAQAEAMRRLRDEAVKREPRIAAVAAERAAERATAERAVAERRARREALKQQVSAGERLPDSVLLWLLGAAC
jgi:hypothetical protein